MNASNRSPVKIKSKHAHHGKENRGKKLSVVAEKTSASGTYKLAAKEPRRISYLQFFNQHTCYDILPGSAKLVILDTELSIKKAFYALVFNNVRASILWNSSKQAFVGMLTITDFIKVLVNDYGRKFHELDDFESSTISQWRTMSDASDSQSLISVSPESSLLEAARMLIKHRFHRLPIIDIHYGNPLHILTHKRILKYLYLNRNYLPQDTFMNQSLQQLGLGTYLPDVQSISKDSPIIDALKVFLRYNISCLPVVDSENRLIELYAKFDVFNLAVTRTYNNLNETIYNALEFHRINRERYPRPMTCLKTATLSSVIERVVSSGIHRLVVVDSRNRLEGIISLSDILKFLVQQSPSLEKETDRFLRVPERV